MNIFRLLIYPLLEVIFFVTGICFIEKNIFFSAGLIFLSSVFLNFSLHISFHYHVHFKSPNKIVNSITDFISSVLMGIPFHYYQMSHWNHHRYDNKIGDFTCTWKSKSSLPIAKNFLFYSFFWPFAGSVKFNKQKEQAKTEGYFDEEKETGMKMEGLIILVFIILLFYMNFFYGFSYLFLVYSGWTMIAMHNYGQHIPEKYGEPKANSYYHKFYNILFFNNGWHYEHHHRPGLKYWELNPESKGKIYHPHLLEGFFFPSEKQQRKI